MICLKYSMQLALPHITVAVKIVFQWWFVV